ncbi:MAG: hypothetical protein QM702_21345 [Rubrivivax sp.]
MTGGYYREMDPKVAKEDLPEIVEEAERLDRADKEQISRSEAREVLRELDIAPEKLEAAEQALAEKRSKEKQKSRTRLMIAAAAIAVAATAAGVWVVSARTSAAVLRAAPVEHVVTANGKPSPFDRATAPEVKLDVTLKDAPQGEKIDLSCDWTDPSGEKAHQNKWTTKSIDKDPWPTHCKYALTPASKTGTWTVTMKQGDRVLSSDPFDVR